ncbi:hypothetical protein M992_2064 [Moellerella wisconsensis ATCC 35017]|uniref:Transposase n=1 Tax=Moellerella wisconsensis ATCC 35017 TaxID=1354267 RepID=A0A0N0ZA84_9GAMM|nr:hypothetical protein M992_2064 [Moellerella wisconsensis ATCC 35017]VFS53708.1 Uncharacterised protein [Moellerella wisconsensis]
MQDKSARFKIFTRLSADLILKHLTIKIVAIKNNLNFESATYLQ